MHLDKIKRHAHLVDTMATRLGVDLEESAYRGDISIPEIEDAVLSCTNCTNPDGCQAWLAARDGRIVDRTPSYCRNTDLFAELAKA